MRISKARRESAVRTPRNYLAIASGAWLAPVCARAGLARGKSVQGNSFMKGKAAYINRHASTN